MQQQRQQKRRERQQQQGHQHQECQNSRNANNSRGYKAMPENSRDASHKGDASNIEDASNGVGRAVWNFNLLLTVTSIIYFCWPVGPIGFLHVTFMSVSFTV